jgi:hypothetical protein
MSVSYLHGFAPLPGLALSSITLTGTTDPPPSVLISRTAYQQQVIGFDFSTALGDVVTLRGEAAYRLPYDYKKHTYAARPDVQYAIGADHNFGSLSVIAQYMGRYVFDWQKEPGTLMDPSVLGGLTMDQIDLATNSVNAELAQTNQILFSQTAQVQHLATLRFEYLALHETLSISALGLVNITTHEYAAMPRIGYKFSDAMIGYLGAQIFRGPNDTLFGLIKNDLTAAYVELRYTF